MSHRKSILASDEATVRPGSPLRRSSRIANSPATASTTTTAPVSRRRSSATETTVSTPAKITRMKRQSLSHEITLEKPQTPKQTTSRASSKSPSAEPEMPENTVGTPTKRGRKPSITKLKEETTKVATPSRRRSIRGQSNSPSKDVEPSAVKPRGRRPSITASASLEVINEAEVTAEQKKTGRPVRSLRRLSVEATEEVESKKEERKHATRRSIRGRSASIDISEELERKQISELNPINEEEREPELKRNLKKVVNDKEQTTAKDTGENVEKTKEMEDQAETSVKTKETEEDHLASKDDNTDSPKEAEKHLDELSNDAVSEISDIHDAESKKENDVVVEKFPSPTKIMDVSNSNPDDIKIDKDNEIAMEKSLSPTKVIDVSNLISSPLQKFHKFHCSESDLVYKSPVRRSPRLSTSPVSSLQESSPMGKNLLSNNAPLEIIKAPEMINSKRTESNTDDSLKINQDLNAGKVSENIEIKSSIMLNSPVKEETKSSRMLKEISEISPINVEDDNDTKAEFENVPATPKEVEKGGTRKTNKLSESMIVSSTTHETSIPLGSKSLDDSNINSPNRITMKLTSQSPTKNVNSDKTSKRNSMLKRTPELLSGSDGSFHLNLSVPTTNSIDINDDEGSRKPLDISSSSNSDKENNADKPNIAKSPVIKRMSLSETSTPKVNKSLKLENFCDPIEVEFTTDVVASAQVHKKTPILSDVLTDKSKTVPNDSVVEIDNENEFGSSPIKTIKAPKNDVSQSDNNEDDLMNSFVDEVLEVDDKEEQPEGVVDISKQNTSVGRGETNLPSKDDNIGDEDKCQDVVSMKSDVPTEKPEFTQSSGGSKRRKVVIKDNISKELDDLINAKLQKVSQEIEDTDEDESSTNLYVDDMASEGEEDTPSEDSNEIIDDGESLHSSESEGIEYDDDYENDSFITDDDGEGPLLSGNEYDLEDSKEDQKKNTKKGKSRIVVLSDSSDEEAPDRVNIQEPQIEHKNSQIIGEKSSVEGENESLALSDEAQPVENRIKVLQNIKISSPSKGNKDTAVVINEEDNLESLEAMKDSLIVVVPREPKPSLSTPNNSIVESPNRKPRRKTSISIQDQISIACYSEGEITEKISKVVDYFVSSIKEKSGNVSLNVSLDYANSSSPESSTGSKRLSLKKNITNNDNEVIDVILQSPVIDDSAKEERVDLNETTTNDKKVKRASEATQTSSVDDLEGQDATDVHNVSISKQKKTKRKSSRDTTETDVVLPIKAVQLKEKRRCNMAQTNDSLESDIDIVNTEVHDVSISKKKTKKKRKSSHGLSETGIVPPIKADTDVPLMKKRRSNLVFANDSLVSEIDIENTELHDESISKKNKTKRKSNQGIMSAEIEPVQKEEVILMKGKKNRSNIMNLSLTEEDLNENTKRFEDITQEDSPRKRKLNKSFGDVSTADNKNKINKTKKSKNLLDGDELAAKDKNLSSKMSPDMEKVLTDILSAPPEEILVKPAKKQKVNLTKSKKPLQTSGEFMVEDEREPLVSKSEKVLTTITQQKLSGGIKKKFKKIKPSLASNGVEWNVEETTLMKPSRKMKEKTSVKLQLEGLKKKLAPNDFKNQMIYGSNVNRMDSKDILRNKGKTGSSKRR